MDSVRRKTLPKKEIAPKVPLTQATLPPYIQQAPAAPEQNVFGPAYTLPRHRQRNHRHRRRFLRFFLFRIIPSLLLIGLSLLGYFSWKVGSATRSMSIDPQQGTALADTLHGAASILTPMLHQERGSLPGESDGRTNILLLGKANEKTAGQNLTDTIMIASFDFSRKKIALLSLPRDLYVEIPETHTFTKLNALYQIDRAGNNEAEIIKKAVSTITGLPIHAFATLDYDGFINIINLVGGVSVYVDQDLFDPHFPGPNYSYETFSIKKGWQDLNGATALKYVRERHSDPEGDFGRAKRQQTILSALKKKAFSLKTILNPLAISGIIDTLGTHIRTDLSLEDMQSIVGLADEFDTTNISTAVIDAWKKDSLLRVSHVPIGSVSMFILVPRTGNWNETRELAQNIFDLDKLRARQAAIESENARITIINRSGTPSLGARVMKFLSENLHMNHVRVAPTSQSAENPESTPSTLDTSTIFRRESTEAVYTTDEIAAKLSLQTENEKSSADIDPFKEYAQSDVLVSLGKDLAKRLSFEEDTVNDMQDAERNPKYQRQLDAALSPEKK